MEMLLVGQTSVEVMWYGTIWHWLFVGALAVIAALGMVYKRGKPLVVRDWLEVGSICFVMWQVDWLIFDWWVVKMDGYVSTAFMLFSSVSGGFFWLMRKLEKRARQRKGLPIKK